MDLMTTAQLLGNFGEFFGAIAVVVTLVFLTRQIRQNTKAIQASMASDLTTNVIENSKSIANDHVLAGALAASAS